MKPILFFYLSFLLLILMAISCLAQNRASFGETCDKTTRCDSRASLTCNNGTCQCIQETEMTYDEKRAKCVVLSGERCGYTAIEIMNDDSDEIPRKKYAEKLDCVENATCQEDGFCGCKPYFFENTAGACLPKLSYGESCSKSEECDSRKNLLCQDGQCSCDATKFMYDPASGQCIGKVGSSCSRSKCVKSAVCQNGASGWTCICPSDYFETSEGPCAPKLGFDETCSNDDECLTKLNLICTDGRCWCNETESLYDYQKDRCVAKAGALRRKYHGDCVENAEWKYQDYRRQEIMSCACMTDFMSTSEGTCTPKLSYGLACATDSECSLNKNLICVNGQCSCKGTEWIHDSRAGKCLVKVGQPCRDEDENYRENGKTLPCVDNAVCDGTICRCKTRDSYSTSQFWSKHGLCYGKYDASYCDPIYSPCLYDLACIGSTCTCPFPKYQTFDSKTQKCVSKLHGPCSEAVDGKLLNFTCQDLMECREDNGVHECLCKKGFIESKKGKCMRDHGSSCRFTSECDEIAGLACWNGTCKCRDFEEYDGRRNLCVGLVGANCGDEGERTIDCSNGAECKSGRDKRITGRCECRPRYKVDSNRKCKLINTK